MEKNEPIHRVKLGKLRAAIWENQAEDTGDVWYNVTPYRRYNSGDEWKSATSFSRDDLPTLVKVIDKAFDWIWDHQAKRKRAERTAA